jgi:hypothetical protein
MVDVSNIIVVNRGTITPWVMTRLIEGWRDKNGDQRGG